MEFRYDTSQLLHIVISVAPNKTLERLIWRESFQYFVGTKADDGVPVPALLDADQHTPTNPLCQRLTQLQRQRPSSNGLISN